MVAEGRSDAVGFDPIDKQLNPGGFEPIFAEIF